MMADEPFDIPHLSEASLPALATLPEMDWRTTVLRVMLRLQAQVDQNTEITADTQETLNRDVIMKLDLMYAVFLPARNFFLMLGVIGNAALWVGRKAVMLLEFIGRLAKPLFFIAAIVAAIVTWFKTGAWVMPDWWGWFLK